MKKDYILPGITKWSKGNTIEFSFNYATQEVSGRDKDLIEEFIREAKNHSEKHGFFESSQFGRQYKLPKILDEQDIAGIVYLWKGEDYDTNVISKTLKGTTAYEEWREEMIREGLDPDKEIPPLDV